MKSSSDIFDRAVTVPGTDGRFYVVLEGKAIDRYRENDLWNFNPFDKDRAEIANEIAAYVEERDAMMRDAMDEAGVAHL